MAQPSIDVVREHIRTFLTDADRSLSLLDPNVVIDHSRVETLDRSALIGREIVGSRMRSYIGAFDNYAYDVERLVDLGGGAILSVVTEGGRGKASGADVRRSFVPLYTVIDGRIVRITVFRSEADARAAVDTATEHPPQI